MIDINRCLQVMGHEVELRIFGHASTGFTLLGREDWLLAQGDQQTIVAALNVIFHPSKDNYVVPTYGDANAS